MAKGPEHQRKAGQRLAMVIAGTGVYWILVIQLGAHFGWSNRLRALLDLVALAGFAWAAIVAIGIWRERQDK
jgi:hypothetical protein